MVKKLFAVSESAKILKSYHFYKSLCKSDNNAELAKKIDFLDNSIAVLPEEFRIITVGSYIEKLKITDLAKNLMCSRQTIYNKQKKAKAMLSLSFDVRFNSK